MSNPVGRLVVAVIAAGVVVSCKPSSLGVWVAAAVVFVVVMGRRPARRH